MARDHPTILCSEVPIELLEACALVSEEPTEFLRELFATGYTQWISQKHGSGVRSTKEHINSGIMVLWLRACRLHTSHVLRRPDAAWDKPFFSDEGLYE